MGGRFNRENWREYIRRFNENDEETTVQAVPNEKAEEWVEREVPYFDCPDPVLEETWYFRWWVFRKHIKDTGRGRIITEFLPRVPWAGPYNSINGANGHHIAEARWLKQDRSLVREYLAFWLRGEGQETSYSSWLADTVYQYALVSGEEALAVDFLPELEELGVKRVSVHYEIPGGPEAALRAICAAGMQAGLVLNPETPVESALPYLAQISQLLLMTVHPGRGGQVYLPGSNEKIAAAKSLLQGQGSNTVIQVDGGITPGTLPGAYAAGARSIVAGRAGFS